jgi:hypothetical protein
MVELDMMKKLAPSDIKVDFSLYRMLTVSIELRLLRLGRQYKVVLDYSLF